MATTEGLKDVEVSLMPFAYHPPLYMSLLLDPVLRSLAAAGFVAGAVFGGVPITYGDEPTGTNRIKL